MLEEKSDISIIQVATAPLLLSAIRVETTAPKPKPSKILAIAALCLALASIASAAIFIKLCEREIGPYTTVFNRFWLTSLTLGAWSGFKVLRRNIVLEQEISTSLQSSPYSGTVIGQLFLVGVLLFADLSLWAWSITQTSIANATLLANLTPIFTCLCGWFIWQRPVKPRFLMGIIVAVGGIFVIGLDDFQLTPDKLQGDIAAVVAAASFSLYLLLLEKLQSQLKSPTIVLWSSIVALILIFPFALLEEGQLFPTSWQGWLTVVGMALICQVLGQGMLLHSLNQLSAEFVALFLLLDPILAAIAAWALFSEQLSTLNILGFIVVLVGTCLGLSAHVSLNLSLGQIFLREKVQSPAETEITG